MPPGPLDKLIENHFSSQEADTAFGAQEQARQKALETGGTPQLDELWDSHSQGRTGYIFEPSPLIEQQRLHREGGGRPDMAPIGPTRPYVSSEEVPDVAKQLAIPPAERRPELRTPHEMLRLKPSGVDLNWYLNKQGIPIPENGTMPRHKEAAKYKTIMKRVMQKQRNRFFSNDTDVDPSDIASIPENHRWYAAWLWRQMVTKDIPKTKKYLLGGEESGVSEHLQRSAGTLGEATGRMKDALHDFGLHFLASPFVDYSSPDREFAKHLDEVRDSTDPAGIRPHSQQVENKSIVELIQEGWIQQNKEWETVKNIAERGYYGALGMVPDVAATVATGAAARLVPAAWGLKTLTGPTASATAYWYARSAPDLRTELMRIGVTDENATYYASIAAVPYAAIEQLQIKQATQAIKRWARDHVKASVKEMMLRQGGDLLKVWGTEWTEEVAQGAIELINTRLATRLSEFDGTVDWDALLRAKAREMQEAAVVIPFLIGPRQMRQAIVDFIDNPSRLNHDALPPQIRKHLGDSNNPGDAASKHSAREIEAGRLKKLTQDILSGFAQSVSDDVGQRSQATELFEGESPTAAEVDTMRPEQRMQLFGVTNPTQETIDREWKRKRDTLRERAAQETQVETPPTVTPTVTPTAEVTIESDVDEQIATVEQELATAQEGIDKHKKRQVKGGKRKRANARAALVKREQAAKDELARLRAIKKRQEAFVQGQTGIEPEPGAVPVKETAPGVQTEVTRLKDQLDEAQEALTAKEDEAEDIPPEQAGAWQEEVDELRLARDSIQEELDDAKAEEEKWTEAATPTEAVAPAAEPAAAEEPSPQTWQGKLKVAAEHRLVEHIRADFNTPEGKVLMGEIEDQRNQMVSAALSDVSTGDLIEEVKKNNDQRERWDSGKPLEMVFGNHSPDHVARELQRRGIRTSGDYAAAEEPAAEEPAAAEEPVHELYAPNGIVATALKLADQGRREKAESLIEDSRDDVLDLVKDRIKQIEDDIEDLALLEIGRLREARHSLNTEGWGQSLIHLADATDFAEAAAAEEEAEEPTAEEPAAEELPPVAGRTEGGTYPPATTIHIWDALTEHSREVVEPRKSMFDKKFLKWLLLTQTSRKKVPGSWTWDKMFDEWRSFERETVAGRVNLQRPVKAAAAAEPAAEPAKIGTKAAAEAAALDEEDDDIDDLEDDDELADLLNDLHDEITGPGAAALGLNPEVMRIAGEISVVLIKKGVKAAVRAGEYTFKKFSRQFLSFMAKKFGADTAAEFKDQLVGFWAGAMYRPEAEVPPDQLREMTQPQEAALWASENIDKTVAAVKEKYPVAAAAIPEPEAPLGPKDMPLAEWIEQQDLGADQEADKERITNEWHEAVGAALANGETVNDEAKSDYRAASEPALRDKATVLAELDEVTTLLAGVVDKESDRYSELVDSELALNEELNRIEQAEGESDETIGAEPAGLGDREDLDQPEPTTGEDATEGGATVPPVGEETVGGGVGPRAVGDEGGVEPTGSEAVGAEAPDPTATGAAASVQPDRPGSPGTNHRIKDEDRIGVGGKKQKFDDNIAAIETLKRIEEEDRKPTAAEKQVLAKYVGWGGLTEAFDERRVPSEWVGRQKELKDALGYNSDAYNAASASTTNAHYTSTQVIKAMWKAVESFGFTGGKVLEPSMGVGHFFGLMPSNLAENSELIGVELDIITGKIASYLYENATVHQTGFEQTVLTPDFDLVIGNVPFGKHTLVDKSGDTALNVLRRKGAGGKLSRPLKIHNFFFGKSLMKTRPGGLIVMLSSTGTLDSTQDGHIDFMKENGADLVGAIRLPGDAFKDNANTHVTTDILVFQKRLEGAAEGGQTWGGDQVLYDTTDRSAAVKASPYWEGNKQHIIGNIVQSEMHGMPNDRMGVKAEGDLTMEDYKPDIDDALGQLKERIDREAFDRTTARTAEQDATDRPAPPVEGDWASLTNWLLEGNFHVQEDDGKFVLWQKQGGLLVELEWTPRSKKDWPRLRSIIEIRDAARFLRDFEKDPEATDESVEELRGILNDVYDAYRKEYKQPLNARRSFSLTAISLSPDPALQTVLALEQRVTHADGTVTMEKADVFSKRLVFPRPPIVTANSPEDALAASLAERGMIDWEYMSDLTKIPVPDLQLALSNILFKNPAGGWEDRSTYLGGKVRSKLAVALRAAETDAQYNRNVEALLAVQPQDWGPDSISVNVGESWISPDIYDTFVAEVVDPMRGEKFHKRRQGYFYIESSGKWDARNKRKPARVKSKGTAAATNEFGTNDIPFDTLMLKYMNGESINVPRPKSEGGGTDPVRTAQAEAAARNIQDRFVEWLWNKEAWDERGSKLIRIYNDLNNDWADPVYDGSHLRLPGMADVWKDRLNHPDRGYQKDNIWRMIVSGNTLLAHAVGAGKTVQMIAAAMEMRRLGLKKRPLFVVPNTLHAQWAADIKEIYPGAKVLAPDSTALGVGQKAYRRVALEQMQTGDWDIILMTPESYEKIPMTEEYITAFYQKEIDELRTELRAAQREEPTKGKKKAPTVKGLEDALTSLQSMMDKMLGELREKQEAGLMTGPYFNEIGIDALFVDEAHEYKNLYSKTRMSRIPGIQTKPTVRPFDMYMKTSFLNKSTNGRGVYFATATPITNTMGEMHVVSKYLAPGLLEERGIVTFDQWAKRYGVVVRKLEVEVAGQGLRPNTRFSNFQNIPGLKQMWNTFVDTKLRKDLDLKLPRIRKDFPFLRGLADAEGTVNAEIVGHHTLGRDQGAIQIAIPINDSQQVEVDALIARTKAIRGGGVDPAKDNMLAVATHGRKIATDMRLVDPNAEDDPLSKTNVMIDNVLEVYERTAEMTFVDPMTGNEEVAGGVQVLWVDRGTPKTKKKKGEEEDFDDGSNDGFNLYADIKNKLVLQGVPEDEVAFIQDYTDPKKKIELFDDLNSSKKRVIIASTQSLSVGANIQRHLVAAHHLDAPWRPADVEQRDGRIIRPGNFSAEIEIYRYVTEKTFDAFMWQTLARKWEFLMDFYKGDTSLKQMEDVGEAVMSPEEMLAAATGDPRMARMIKLQTEVTDLERKRTAHDRQVYSSRTRLSTSKSEQATAVAKATEYEEAAEHFGKQRALLPEDHKTGVEFFVKSTAEEDGSIPADGQYSKPGDAGQALLDWLLTDLPEQQLGAANKTGSTYEIGKVFGMTLKYSETTAEVWGRLPGSQHLKFSGKLDHKNPYTAFQSIFNKIKGLAAESETYREKANELSKEMRYLEGLLADPDYPKKRELDSKKDELAQLQHDIATHVDEPPPVNTLEGDAGEAKMQTLRDESSAIVRQQRLMQDKVDEWQKFQSTGYPATPMSPYANQPFNNYMAVLPFVPGQERPRGSQLQQKRGSKPADPLSIPQQLQAPPGPEARMQAAHGIPRETMLHKILAGIRYIFRAATRAETEISIPTVLRMKGWDRDKARAAQQFIGPALEYFRLLKNVASVGEEAAYRIVHSITGNLDREHFWIFERYVIVQNMLRALDLDQPRRYEWESRQQIEAYKRKLDDFIDGTDVTYRTQAGELVNSDGMPHIRQAIEARNRIIREVVQEQIDLNLLPARVMETTEDYFHQQIVALSQSTTFAKAARSAKPAKRGYQRKRVGVEVVGEEMPPLLLPDGTEVHLDPNTDYLQAELTWLIEAQIEAEKKRLFKMLDEEYGKKTELKKEAKRLNYLNVVGGEANLKRIRELERNIGESMEGEDSGESDQLAMRKSWRESLERLDPTYEFRQKKGMMRGIVEEETDILTGMETDEEFFEKMVELAHQPVEEPGVKAARGFFKAIAGERKMYRERLGIEEMTWDKLRRRDHPELSVYAPEGNTTYKAYAVPEQMIRRFQEGLIDSINIKDLELDVDEVRVLAGQRVQYLLPNEIVNQLKKLEARKDPGDAAVAYEKMVGAWKAWVLLNPKRALPYNLRNLTGDIDPVLAAAPGIVKYMVRARRELWEHYQSQKGEKYILPKMIILAIKHGIIGSGLTATEIPDARQTESLDKLYMEAQKDGGILNPIVWGKKYFSVVKGFSEFRENMLRYAAFLYYMDTLDKGKLKHYGTSRKHIILGIQKAWGNTYAAGRLSRELLGDYSNLTEMGDWLRRKAVIPFWAFQEINLKRYPMLMLNAFSTAKMSGEDAARGFGVASGAITMAALTVRIGLAYAAVMMFNWLVMGDEEDELPPFEKENLHINLGRTADGQIRVFRNVGALGDFLEWFGLNELAGLIPLYGGGQIDAQDVVEEMANSSMNKLVGGMGPQKWLFEIATGESYFPDFTSPRTVDRWDHAMSIVNWKDEFRWTKGMLMGEGDRARPHYIDRMWSSVDHPGQAALSSIYDLRERFLKKKGESRLPARLRSSTRKMKWAAMNGDYEAFKESKAEYLKKPNNTYSSFAKSLRYLDPLEQRLRDSLEVEFENEFLTAPQRGTLRLARDYAQELRVQMWQWWQTAAAESKGEVGLSEAIEGQVSAKVKTMARAKPLKKSKQAKWRLDQQKASRWLRERGFTRRYILKQYEGSLTNKGRARSALRKAGIR